MTMSCAFEANELQIAINGGDGRAVKLAAIDLAICKLEATIARLIAGQIGNAADVTQIESEIDALENQRNLIQLQGAALPMLSQATLQAFETSISDLETAIAQSQAAAGFLAASGALRQAAAKLAEGDGLKWANWVQPLLAARIGWRLDWRCWRRC
jgi:hypothetical protein